MSEQKEKEVNIEEIISEIRKDIRIKKRVSRNIGNLADAMKEVQSEIEENEYVNDLPSFDDIPLVSFSPLESLNVDNLRSYIQSTKGNCAVGPYFPVEGNALKRIYKKASQKAIRNTILPLTSQVTNANIRMMDCMQYMAEIITAQQKQIESLSAQISQLVTAMNEEG